MIAVILACAGAVPMDASTEVMVPGWVEFGSTGRPGEVPPALPSDCSVTSTELPSRPDGAVLVVRPGRYTVDVTCGAGRSQWTINAHFMDAIVVRAWRPGVQQALKAGSSLGLDAVPFRDGAQVGVSCVWAAVGGNVARVVGDGRAGTIFGLSPGETSIVVVCGDIAKVVPIRVVP